MKIVGYRHYDFVDKKTNKQFKGLSFYYNDQLAESETQFGFQADKFTIGEQYIESVLGSIQPKALVGKNVKLEYNKYGNIYKLIVIG